MHDQYNSLTYIFSISFFFKDENQLFPIQSIDSVYSPLLISKSNVKIDKNSKKQHIYSFSMICFIKNIKEFSSLLYHKGKFD